MWNTVRRIATHNGLSFVNGLLMLVKLQACRLSTLSQGHTSLRFKALLGTATVMSRHVAYHKAHNFFDHSPNIIDNISVRNECYWAINLSCMFYVFFRIYFLYGCPVCNNYTINVLEK